jgi:cyclase
MRRVSKNVYAEVLRRGCNPSYLVTSDGIVMIDTPQQPIDALNWREKLEEIGPIRYLVNTEPHPDHIRGNCYFKTAEVIGQRGMGPRYDAQQAGFTSDAAIEQLKQSDPDSVWLVGHPDYPPHGPTTIFDEEHTVEVGNHTIQCLHTPGHTAPQTAVLIKEEGVICIGDTIFHKVQTWLQEADPWVLLDTLDRLGTLDYEVIVPGHGETCDKSYLKEQAQVVHNWLGEIEKMIDRGLTEEEAIKQPPATADPWPPQQMQWHWENRIREMNVANLYRRVLDRQGKKKYEMPSMRI